ncbi:MAG: DsbA family protein, partial [Gemmatimonadota bacterium]
VDLECPVCKTFHATLKAVQSRVGNLASVVFVAYPLPQHRFALPAARAMECAGQAGHATSWLDVVLRKQDSIGLRSWGEFALEAGIPDTASISRCARNPSLVVRIDSGLVLGERLGVNGTPTVFVNGWRMPGLPTREALVEKIYEEAGTRRTRAVP